VLVAAPESFTDVVPSLLPLTDHLTLPSAPPKTYPALVLAEAERDVALRRLDVEKSRAWPDMTATVGVRRLEGDRATVLVGGMSFPIPVFDQNSGNISAAGSAVAAADARLAAARAQAETGWQAALLQANAATTRLAAVKSAAAAAGEAYQLARTGFDAGKVSLLDLLSARRALTDAKLRLLDVRIAQIGAHAALARLSGTLPFGAAP
jgi:cobalt-zinc-cadmium efflux system outer membrane protein